MAIDKQPKTALIKFRTTRGRPKGVAIKARVTRGRPPADKKGKA